MPRERLDRYFPKSLDINDDPEVWDFTDLFGDRAMRTFDQVFANIERTRNHWRLVGDWSATLSRKVRQTPANVRRQVDHMLAKGWLTVREQSADGSPLVLSSTNYWKFHKRPEHKVQLKGTPQEPLLLSFSPSFFPKELRSGTPTADSVDKSGDKGDKSQPDTEGAPPSDFRTVCDALLDLAIKIGHRAPVERRTETQHKLSLWVRRWTNDMKDEPPERMEAVIKSTLKAIEARAQKHGEPIHNLWPYLDVTFARERIKYIQGPEHEANKKPLRVPEAFGEIMQRFAGRKGRDS